VDRRVGAWFEDVDDATAPSLDLLDVFFPLRAPRVPFPSRGDATLSTAPG
jgi:hypothetical protein